MKKLFAGVLALSLLLAGCGAAEPGELPETLLIPETQVTELPQDPRPAGGEITITMENWETYFELRPVAERFLNEQGQTESWSFGQALVLKEEYLPLYQESRVDFEIGYRETACILEADAETGEYTLGETLEEPRDRQKTVGLQDFRMEEPNLISSLQGAVAACVLGGGSYTREDGSLAAVQALEPQVLHAEGTLSLQ